MRVWVGFHKIFPSYLRRSFRTLLKGSSSGKFRMYAISLRGDRWITIVFALEFPIY
jgi:hypothetical protein